MPKQLVSRVHRRVAPAARLSRGAVSRAIAQLVTRAAPLRVLHDATRWPRHFYRVFLRKRPIEVVVDEDDDGDGVVVDLRTQAPPVDAPVEEELTSGTFSLAWETPRSLATPFGITGAGIYVLERGGRPIYVGQSTELSRRLLTHRNAFRRAIGDAVQTVTVRIARVSPAASGKQLEDNLQTVERVLIRYLVGNLPSLLGRPLRSVPTSARTGVYRSPGVPIHNDTSFQPFLVPPKGAIVVDLGANRPTYLSRRNLTLAPATHYEA